MSKVVKAPPKQTDVEWWPVEKPIAYARNARVIPDAAIGKVAASIKEFGFKNPMLVTGDGVLIAGHTRLLAAQRLGLERVPVIVCDDLTDAQTKALRLADNRTGQEATWDYELLGIELEDLAGLDIDLSLTGFDAEELLALEGDDPQPGLTDEDAAPEIPETPVTQTGDVWLLGKHRLMCGDSTSAADVTLLMDGKRAVLMATDPPYLVDYDGGNHPGTVANGGKWEPGMGNPTKWKANEGINKEWDAYVDPESSVAFYRDFLCAALEHALGEHVAIYQCFAAMRSTLVFESWLAAGILAHQMLIWKKSRKVLTHCNYLWDYEPIMYGWKQGSAPKVKPPANATTTWDIDSNIEDTPGSIHPTMKPVELIRRPIEYHTTKGGLIYEPFSGSGTAIIAAQSTGRACYAMEQSPAFVDAAVTRWEAYTGEAATHATTGASFQETAAQRGV